MDGKLTMTSRTSLSLVKKLTFSFLTLLLFFALLELVLFALGVQPVLNQEDPFVGFSGSIPLYVADGESSVPDMMMTAPNKRSHFNVQRFPRSKPINTFRIFCLGGSTTYGRPYDDVTSFPGWLRELLPVADPKLSWEVINAGGISYASYRIAALVEELIQYEPDLLVIYTGHNEFLEQRTYPELSTMSPVLMKSVTTAARFRTYTVVQQLLSRTRFENASPYQMSQEVDEILDHTVGPSSYHRNDHLRDQVIQHFELNLRRIIDIARAGGAKVVLIAPASNLKDCAPFKSQHRSHLSDLKKQQFEESLDRAQSLQLQRKPKQALIQTEQALKIDDRYAELHYRRAQLFLETQQMQQALTASQQAQEEDVCPLRAIAGIREACQRVADTTKTPLIDFHQQLQQQCAAEHQHRLPGHEYFLDHVHLRPAVHRQLAIHIVESMLQNALIANKTDWENRDLTVIDRRVYGRVDETAHASALRNLAKVLNWAGKHLEAGALAVEALETLSSDPEALLLAAPYLKTMGRFNEAIDHYQRALAQMPDHAEGHQLLGALLAEMKHYREAKKHFLEVLRIDPNDWQAHRQVAIVCTQLKQFHESIPHYQVAVKHDPQQASTHYHYALSLAGLDQIPAAIGEYRKTILLDSQNSNAHFNLATLLEDQNPDQSRDHYQQAVLLNPQDAEALFRLGVLLEAKDPRAAAGYYRRALKIQPGFRPAQNRLEQLLGTPPPR